MLFGNQASEGKKPTTPTIGTAIDDGTGTGVSVPFTPSTYIGKSTITYTATSSPGSLTGTGSGSPITVSGLTTGQAYTFTVAGTTNYGVASDSSAASNSVTPASPSSFESIATATGTGSNSSITFSSIPSTYKHLQIRAIGKSTTAGTGNLELRLQFNSDTGSNYTTHYLRGSGTAATASGSTARTSIWAGGFNQAGDTGINGSIIDIIDYASTSKNKTTRSVWGNDQNGSGNIYLGSGLWISTSAVNSITITPESGNFGTTVQIALYGIKG